LYGQPSRKCVVTIWVVKTITEIKVVVTIWAVNHPQIAGVEQRTGAKRAIIKTPEHQRAKEKLLHFAHQQLKI